jgi:type IX secretion system PorP/SprF family membrane protein
MKKLLGILIALGMAVSSYAQQEALYGQYMQNPLTVNPAYTGIYNMFSATGISRWQWVGMEGAPRTNTLTAHSTVANNKLGVGGMFVYDQYGVSNNTEAYVTAAYKLRLSDNEEHVLSYGMQVGMMSYRYDYGDLKKKDETDPNFIANGVAATEPNFGAGLVYKSERVFVGFSVPKILNSELADGPASLTRYRRHYFLNAAYLFDLTSVQVKPSVLVKYVEGAPLSVDYNLSFLLKDVLWLGAGFRNFNTGVAMAQLQVSDMFRLGYALEIPTNSIVRGSYGTHELMLNIDLRLLKSHDIGLRYF